MPNQTGCHLSFAAGIRFATCRPQQSEYFNTRLLASHRADEIGVGQDKEMSNDCILHQRAPPSAIDSRTISLHSVDVVTTVRLFAGYLSLSMSRSFSDSDLEPPPISRSHAVRFRYMGLLYRAPSGRNVVHRNEQRTQFRENRTR